MPNPETAQEKAKKQMEADRKRLLSAVARITSKEDGRTLIRWLMKQCGFTSSSVVVNPETSEVALQSTLYNEVRRGVYLELRNMIPKKQLMKIEFNLENDDDVDVDDAED